MAFSNSNRMDGTCFLSHQGGRSRLEEARGGECKALENGDVLILWYGSKQSLTVSGLSAEAIKAKCAELLNNGPDNIVGDDSMTSGSLLVNEFGHGCALLSTEEDVGHANKTSIETAIVELSRKFSVLESSVRERVNAFKSEIQDFKGSAICSRYDEDYIITLKKSDNNLKDENEAFKEKVADLSYLLSDLRREIRHVEEERQSLVTAIKIL